jgi:hypothetical protein
VKKLKTWAYSKPSVKLSKGKTVAGKALNGVVYAGTKVAQWTVRPGLKAYDVGKGKKRKA